MKTFKINQKINYKYMSIKIRNHRVYMTENVITTPHRNFQQNLLIEFNYFKHDVLFNCFCRRGGEGGPSRLDSVVKGFNRDHRKAQTRN